MVILGLVPRLGHLFHLHSGGTVPLAGHVPPGCCGGRTRGCTQHLAQRAAEGGEEKGKAELSSGVQVWVVWMCPVLGFRFKAKILM